MNSKPIAPFVLAALALATAWRFKPCTAGISGGWHAFWTA